MWKRSRIDTLAWFKVDASVGVNYTSETGSLTATVSNPQVGGFTFVLDGLSSSDTQIDLTDENGKSYVYIDNTHTVEVTPGDPTAEFTGLTWVVNYSGPSNTAAKIQAEWAQVAALHPAASVAATSNDGNTHVVRFGDNNASASQCVNGAYAMSNSVSLSDISWTSVTVSGPSNNAYTASINLSEYLTKTGFAAALTGLTTNEGEAANGTHGITIATTLTNA